MRWIALNVTLASWVVLSLGGCAKKPAPAPAATPPPPAPTASLTANPSTIESGRATTLTWQTSNANDVSIDQLGAVDPNGSRSVSPTESTTYHLTAKGPGGTQDATARVTVTPSAVQQAQATEEELFNQNVRDIYFDYDKYSVRADQQSALAADAAFLQAHPGINFTIEGHCDERGSTEYNLGLGDNRANEVKRGLVQAGIAASRIKTISYGKEKPFCTASNESCWQQNRRGHFVYNK